MQKRYWEMLTQKHYELLFIQEHSYISIRTKRYFDIFSALASSGAIGAWAIWQKYDLVWALILAVFQVITVLRPVIPFDKRVVQLDKLSVAWSEQYAFMEKDWFPISKGKINDDTINEMIYEYDKKWTGTGNLYMQYDFLEENEKIKQKVEAENLEHFKSFPNQ